MKDSTWVMYQKRIEQAIAEKSWFTLGTIYYEMAARVEVEGLDAKYLKDKGYEAKLRSKTDDLDNHLLSNVEIMCNMKDSCEPCKSQNGLIVSAEDARLNNPIPVKDCKNGFGCRCVYLPIVD